MKKKLAKSRSSCISPLTSNCSSSAILPLPLSRSTSLSLSLLFSSVSQELKSQLPQHTFKVLKCLKLISSKYVHMSLCCHAPHTPFSALRPLGSVGDHRLTVFFIPFQTTKQCSSEFARVAWAGKYFILLIKLAVRCFLILSVLQAALS